MDNKFTRKEELCPLIGGYCNQADKNCDRCIGEEMEWQEEQCIKECLKE